MGRSPPRIATVLAVTAGVGLALQGALFLAWTGCGRLACVAGALFVGVSCLAWSWHAFRRALRPLAIESWRLQEMAIGWEADRALSSASLLGMDRTLHEVERLRRDLFGRLEESSRLRQRAEEASEYKTGFLKSVQHELRTPLNSILGFAEVLLSGIEGPLTTGQRENLVVVRRTGKRLQDLFDEVVELAATAAGQLELRHAPVDIGAVLEELGEALEEERGDRPVHIQVELAEGLLRVAGDEERLKRFVKGIANQTLAVLSGPLLVLAAAPHGGGEVRVSVRDPGRKLARDEIESLLGQEPTPVRRRGLDEGSRLRIALWRQLAELFGGRLELKSDEHGTELGLELPAWSEPESDRGKP